MKIERFFGQWRFLSNFYPVDVEYEGVKYSSVEAAYQAAKSLSPITRERIRKASSPGSAKSIGRRIKLRPDWEQIKMDVMRGLLEQKFSYASLRSMLLSTGDAELIEGNDWGDRFWGVYLEEGENHLGKLLMALRADWKAWDGISGHPGDRNRPTVKSRAGKRD